MTFTITLIIVWVAIACLADMFFKQAHSFTDPNYVWGCLLYGCTTLIAVITFRRAEFGSVAVIWIAASLLISLIISAFWYHEPFTKIRAIAALMALAAVILAQAE